MGCMCMPVLLIQGQDNCSSPAFSFIRSLRFSFAEEGDEMSGEVSTARFGSSSTENAN